MRIESLRGVIEEKTHKLDISKKGHSIKELKSVNSRLEITCPNQQIRQRILPT